MSFYRIVFNDGKSDYYFFDSCLLSRFVEGNRFRSDVFDIILELV